MREIETIAELQEVLKKSQKLENLALQGLNLKPLNQELLNTTFKNCLFLGCQLETALLNHLLQSDNQIFPTLDVPFKPYRGTLYKPSELFQGFNQKTPSSYRKTPDNKIYEHYLKTGKGKAKSIKNSLARRLHDHSITDALHDELEKWPETKVVAIMGGHSISRTSEDYKKVAIISKLLCESGHLMVSGGGPGAMEATHLGALFTNRPLSDLDKALKILKKAETYKDENWLSTAFEVLEKFPPLQESNYHKNNIGIPTWLYGHEPPTPFASQIAKYFANSIREEGLLAIAKGGVIYSPGSAGTIQEIFQDAAQNHYKSFDLASPMVFLNSKYWTIEKPVYPILLELAENQEYSKLISISDTPEEIAHQIKTFSEQHQKNSQKLPEL